MSDLLHETTAPLAWDSEGMPFQLPPGTVAFKVRLYTGNRGRPAVVWGAHGPLHLEPGATMDDLRAGVKNKPGSYRLYPINEAGEELSPVACIEITARDEAEELAVLDAEQKPTRAPMPGLEREGRAPGRGHTRGTGPGFEFGGTLDVTYLFERMLASRDEHDRQMTAIVNKLVDSTAVIQHSMAELFQVTNNTIKVSSGLDALERLPPPPTIDVEEIAEKLADFIEYEDADDDDAEPEDKPKEKKTILETIGDVMKGPLGMVAAQMVTKAAGKYVDAFAAQQQAVQATAQAMEAEAKAEKAKAETEEARARAVRESIEEEMRARGEEHAEELDEELDDESDKARYTEPDDEVYEPDEYAHVSEVEHSTAPRPGQESNPAQTAEPDPAADNSADRAASAHAPTADARPTPTHAHESAHAYKPAERAHPDERTDTAHERQHKDIDDPTP